MKRRLLAILILIATVLTLSAAKKYVLVIDAGHGGHDAGAVGQMSKEKDINLNTALAFGRYVERNCPDVTVIYTRKRDVFVPLHERADIANKNHADVFISIHVNALPNGKISRGLETYTMGMRRSDEKLSAAQRENSVIMVEEDYKERYAGYDPNSPESTIMFEFINDKNMAKSVELAKLVQRNVCSTAGRPDKGVKQDVFLVLRETSMPACLIELGFISTPDEERALNDPNVIDNIARGIYNAFVKYKGDNKPRLESTTPAPTPVAEPKAEPKTKVEPKVEPKSKVEPKPKVEPKAEPKVEPKAEPKKQVEPDKPIEQVKPATRAGGDDAVVPVFKVQVFTSDQQLKANDARLKGKTADFYKDGKIFKYTIGNTTDYNEILRLRRELANIFPGCFIIAFHGTERIDTATAISEFRNKNKR